MKVIRGFRDKRGVLCQKEQDRRRQLHLKKFRPELAGKPEPMYLPGLPHGTIVQCTPKKTRRRPGEPLLCFTPDDFDALEEIA